MHQRYTLWFTIFPFVMLLIYFLSYTRAKHSDQSINLPPEALHAARKARFATLVSVLVISVVSWTAAILMYAGSIDLSEIVRPGTIHLLGSVFFVLIALVGFAFMTWKLNQFELRIKSGEITDPALVGSLDKAKSMRWTWAGLMIMFAIIIAVR